MMYSFKYFVYFAILCITFISCQNDEKLIRNVVDKTYTQLITNIDFRQIDSSYLSSELNLLIKRNNEIELAELKKMKQLQSTDKPPMIEGDLFSSNYEGATSFESTSIVIHENKTAEVVMEFEYKNTNPVYHWSDTIQIINENNSWKIDDVYYFNHDTSTLSMKNTIKYIIEHEINVSH